ncbi:TPA: exodeoxyribonuclease VIII [Escherichia coli]|uniref:Exodeoxyribonuclease VIII n=2 Tax=Escherichia coli TaxID=562 RepID=A0A827S8L7_ECOLX|nr:exodeoxyribonuclease VIII [Escherichia coli]AEJ56360.1 exodeoxyribonuclease 8 (Exodeoxyribonuclease VIII) (EXOVIII) [Escherichia coli UMNF18]EEQ2329522.1 exodeoxyribonuclease VIII [Escherichia coli]EEQ2660630.1 exodeoxyribonuclease VIII [Escherichia coli]EEQ2797845.1 exodeoxyribonuclease VIII [Escherichia coli]EEQ3832738.1 exodeoxyribonuclease VIII [Escherichia coli]
MSTKPLFLLRKAKKSSGEPDVVLWASDDFESTCATLDYLIVKSGKKLSNYFKAIATNFPVVNDLPPEGEIDFTWSERYQLSKDSMTWELKPGAAPDDVHHQDNAQETNELAGGQEENAQADAHEDCQDCEVSVATLRFTQRLLHIFTYAAGDRKYLHHATREQRKHITALEMDQENSYVQNLLLAIRSMAEPTTLDNAALLRLTDAIKAVFSITKKHQPYEFKNFISAWLDTEHIDRGLLTKEWRKGNRVSRITRTASGANAGGGNLTDRGEGFVHDLTSLARDVATGVLARSMDVDIYNLHPAHAKRVEEIIAENKPPFSVFRDKFITMPGGLDYSRAIVVASVKEAPIGIEVIPAHVTEYLNKVLTETDHANPDPEIVDIACGRSSAPMPQRVTEEEKQDDEEKLQPSCAMADEQATAETVEPDATEHHQDTQSLDAQSQVNSVDAKYQKLRAELHEARKNIPPKNPVDADKLLAASRGEFVEGISDPNDPKWVKGIQTRDSVYQNQPETEKTSPDVKQPEPVVQQEPEIVCNACGQTGGDNCPDCGAVMGDATYQETFDEENQVEAKENDPEEMEGTEHPHKENAGNHPHHDCSDETGEASAHVATEIMWPSYFEPGRYENLPNEVYHSANGISSTMLKDARISLMYYHGRHIAGTIPNEESDALLRGRIIHSYVLETDKFADEYAIPVPVPEYVVTTSNELITIIKKYNASLPSLMTPEQMKEWIESYNSTLIQPLSVSAGAEETGILYGSLPEEFRRIPEGEKHTASAMKACIKEYNASLPPLLKTSGTREQLLEQIETVDPELAKKERAKSLPYNISGTKEQLTEIARKIRPELVTLENWQKRQQEENAGKTFISPDMYEQAKNIHAALQNNTDAARLLNHPERKSEISYFGFDEETGLEIRVRPDIEIRLPYESICADVKSVSLGYVRQERLKDRLHREIIERDYHLSAAMYCDVANLDKFFWIFVNKDAGYHWVAVVEASQELLELGRQEYRRTLRQINEALETNNWPAPITESYTDELNDFDLRRLEALSI